MGSDGGLVVGSILLIELSSYDCGVPSAQLYYFILCQINFTEVL